MAGNERGRGQIEDQAPIQLLVEVEIEVVERPLRIAKLCCFRRRFSSLLFSPSVALLSGLPGASCPFPHLQRGPNSAHLFRPQKGNNVGWQRSLVAPETRPSEAGQHACASDEIRSFDHSGERTCNLK